MLKVFTNSLYFQEEISSFSANICFGNWNLTGTKSPLLFPISLHQIIFLLKWKLFSLLLLPFQSISLLEISLKFLLWRRQWHSTPVLLPGKSHRQRSLVGCSPWGREESDMTERLPFHFSFSCTGEGNGTPLQCSCLENPRDGGAWWAAVYGIAQSWTRLKRLSSSSICVRHCLRSRANVHVCVLSHTWLFVTQWTAAH